MRIVRGRRTAKGHCFVHSLIVQGIHGAVGKDVAVVEGGGGEVVPIGVPQIAGPNLYPLVVHLSDRHGAHQLVPRKTKLILVPVHNLVLSIKVPVHGCTDFLLFLLHERRE